MEISQKARTICFVISDAIPISDYAVLIKRFFTYVAGSVNIELIRIITRYEIKLENEEAERLERNINNYVKILKKKGFISPEIMYNFKVRLLFYPNYCSYYAEEIAEEIIQKCGETNSIFCDAFLMIGNNGCYNELKSSGKNLVSHYIYYKCQERCIVHTHIGYEDIYETCIKNWLDTCRKNGNNSVKIVFLHEHLGWQGGVCNPETINKLYFMASS